MKLFTGLKKIREFEKLQLPFLKSVLDFDILIEIGYAEEQGQPLTLKQLFLVNVSSRTTVRRKLSKLIEQGMVVRRKHAVDRRASLLTDSFVHDQTAGQVCRRTENHFSDAFQIGCIEAVCRNWRTRLRRSATCMEETFWGRSWVLRRAVDFAAFDMLP